MDIKKFVKIKNYKKKLFTPGPASLLTENIEGLEPCFGRGDVNYINTENFVLSKIKIIAGHNKIVRLQGSASLALEIAVNNFLYGKVLIIDTGIYSSRLYKMSLNSKKLFSYIKILKIVNWKKLSQITEKFDWIVSCVTETSAGLKLPILDLWKLKKRCNSKLLLDTTASIGLEINNELSDVSAFSSCKGLFGLTGASFITFNNYPKNFINSFYLSLDNHINKLMTGPYHTIQSLYSVMKNYNDLKYAVIENKKFFLKKYKDLSPYPIENQPNLCTYITKKFFPKNNKVILYQPRSKLNGSIICHLGEVHLKRDAKGKILNNLKLQK